MAEPSRKEGDMLQATPTLWYIFNTLCMSVIMSDGVHTPWGYTDLNPTSDTGIKIIRCSDRAPNIHMHRSVIPRSPTLSPTPSSKSTSFTYTHTKDSFKLVWDGLFFSSLPLYVDHTFLLLSCLGLLPFCSVSRSSMFVFVFDKPMLWTWSRVRMT